MIDVNNKLLEWRKFYGDKEKQVADTMRIKHAKYANYECGRHFPDIEGLVKLSIFYGISLDELVGDDTNGSNKIVLMSRDR